jgi:uncharacterized protein HemX
MFQTIKLVVFLVIVLLLGAGAWYITQLAKDNATLKANEETLKTAISEQQAVIEQQKADYEQILSANAALNEEINKVNKAKQELQEKLSKHDINFLAVEKPKLIERIINKGSNDVLSEFETITQ